VSWKQSMCDRGPLQRGDCNLLSKGLSLGVAVRIPLVVFKGKACCWCYVFDACPPIINVFITPSLGGTVISVVSGALGSLPECYCHSAEISIVLPIALCKCRW